MNTTIIIIVMALYLAGMLYVGYISNKKSKGNNQDEFYLGNRKIGPLVTAMSAEASDMSSYLVMGLPGLAYLTGLSDVGWTIIGLAIGTYLNWLLVSKRLRRMSEELGAITIPDFFSKRYKDDNNVILVICAIIIMIFFVPYTASGFKAIGTLFNTLFGVNYHVAMVLGALIVVLYTVIGGFLAVSTTDLMQSIVMSFALLAIVCFGIYSAGGMGAVIDSAANLPGYLSMTNIYDPASDSASGYGPITIVSTMAWGLGYFGMPHILLRFMAIRHEDELDISRRIGSIWVVISMSVAVLLGVVGLAASNKGIIDKFTTSSESETVIIQLAYKLSELGALPAIVAGLTMSGILASTMSTADSQLLQASSSFSKNILQDFFGIKMSDKTALMLARLSVLIIAVIGIFLAWNPESSVFTIVSFAWAGFGACFGPLMLLSLFWEKTSRVGALMGLISGGVVIFVWKFMIRPLGGVWNIYELLPAFIISLVFIIIGSVMFPQDKK